MSEILAIPKISIGMPVYNGEQYIKSALDSLLGQTFSDFELIISDNASTDETERICREYAGQDQRIRYLRQPTNLGAEANFQYVLDEARSEYFMWAACDDIRSQDFVELNFKFLSEHPEYVASTSPDGVEGVSLGKQMFVDFALDGEQFERFTRFFEHCWVSHGIFYSLMRSEVIQGCDVFSQNPFIGADWAIDLYLASKGKVHRVRGGYTIFGIHGISRDPGFVKTFRNNAIELLLPIYRLTRYVINLRTDFSLGQRARIILILLKLNLQLAITPLLHTLHSIRRVVVRSR